MSDEQPVKRKNKPGAGRPHAIETEARKFELLLEAIQTPMPLSYACDLVRLPRQTVRDTMNRDENFRAEVAVAKAIGIRKLILSSAKQNSSFKLLKNLANDEFNDNVAISTPQPLQVNVEIKKEKFQKLLSNPEFAKLAAEVARKLTDESESD